MLWSAKFRAPDRWETQTREYTESFCLLHKPKRRGIGERFKQTVGRRLSPSLGRQQATRKNAIDLVRLTL
jgi:hypothetical protein